tara:strand:+ start:1148 stop:1804 length:657 start_codon:yes stop_codon:yes gene_type:complete
MKQKFRKIVRKIWQLSFYFIALTRIYPLWSKLYRWLYHEDYKNIPIAWKLTPEQADEKCQTLTWTKDSAKEMFDAIGSPHWVQHCIDSVKFTGSQPPGALDCDEYASWCAVALDNRLCPMILSVSYMNTWEGSLKPGGHNVCVYLNRKTNEIYHIGNWGICGPYSSLESVVRDICYSARKELIGWALYDSDLNLRRFSIQYPKGIKFYDLMETYYLSY